MGRTPRQQKDASPRPQPTAAGRLEQRAGWLASGLLLLLLLQGLVFITESSQTSDEAAHLAAGYSYLLTRDFRLNPEHPPLLKELAALPLLPLRLEFPFGPLWEIAEEWNIGRLFVHENRVPNDTLLLLGRLPTLVLSLLLGFSLYHWARRLFGAPGALLGLSLYVLDPNVVAHSGLVTTDLGVSLFMFLAVYAFWCWSARPARRTLLLFGLAVGAAFASKFTAAWLLPILAALGVSLLALRAPLPRRPLRDAARLEAPAATAVGRLGALGTAAAAVIAIAFVVITLSYAVSGLPAFLEGWDRSLHHSAIGHRAYLMGEVSESGWWYYFLFAWLIKTPPGTIVIVAASIVAMALGRRRNARDELFLWLPVLITIAITCAWKVNIGLRHILPIYPFLYLGAGRLLMPAAARPAAADPAAAGGSWIRRAGVPALVLALGWNGVEAARIVPYHLAYFTPLIGGPSRGHEYLLDSNLDWGQSARALRRFMDSQNLPMIYCAFSGNTDPWFYGVRYQYVPGTGNLLASKKRPARMPERVPRELFAVSAMVVHSLHFSNPDLYDWLADRKPVAMPGYSFFVYDITGEAESHAYIAGLCLNFKLWDLAEYEVRRALSWDPNNELAHAVRQRLDELAREPETRGEPPGP
jgi:4-amino-4-deoxy-L-arabinose transferase-like glycosyltransferase